VTRKKIIFQYYKVSVHINRLMKQTSVSRSMFCIVSFSAKKIKVFGCNNIVEVLSANIVVTGYRELSTQ